MFIFAAGSLRGVRKKPIFEAYIGMDALR